MNNNLQKRSTKKGRPLFFVRQAPLRRQLAPSRTPLTSFAPAPPIVIFAIATQ